MVIRSFNRGFFAVRMTTNSPDGQVSGFPSSVSDVFCNRSLIVLPLGLLAELKGSYSGLCHWISASHCGHVDPRAPISRDLADTTSPNHVTTGSSPACWRYHRARTLQDGDDSADTPCRLRLGSRLWPLFRCVVEVSQARSQVSVGNIMNRLAECLMISQRCWTTKSCLGLRCPRGGEYGHRVWFSITNLGNHINMVPSCQIPNMKISVSSTSSSATPGNTRRRRGRSYVGGLPPQQLSLASSTS